MNTKTPGFTFGMRLGYIREAYALTKTAIAKSVNVSSATWSSYENDNTFPSKKTIQLFCNIYRVNEDWLMTNEGGAFLEQDAKPYSDKG